MEKLLKPKKDPLKIYLTSLSYREIKKNLSDLEKVPYIDVSKMIFENFGTEKELNDIQNWILNQMVVKKIESLKGSSTSKIFVIIKDPTKSSAKSFKEILKDSQIGTVSVEVYP